MAPLGLKDTLSGDITLFNTPDYFLWGHPASHILASNQPHILILALPLRLHTTQVKWAWEGGAEAAEVFYKRLHEGVGGGVELMAAASFRRDWGENAAHLLGEGSRWAGHSLFHAEGCEASLRCHDLHPPLYLSGCRFMIYIYLIGHKPYDGKSSHWLLWVTSGHQPPPVCDSGKNAVTANSSVTHSGHSDCVLFSTAMPDNQCRCRGVRRANNRISLSGAETDAAGMKSSQQTWWIIKLLWSVWEKTKL